ncbi:hypothetical protein BT96DRAFT_946990 [Gymnopus androsaceus JB14]|uniref:F-box domain-containing protein n=1 Tax=Gymnopus androsaceus JB14 TaxID=1447944 RepID=A0A6A4GTY0_9AGAR|nr:hypothetical protein BT96DRAFT_946990 [Gymnopus androsaceus JB14]
MNIIDTGLRNVTCTGLNPLSLNQEDVLSKEPKRRSCCKEWELAQALANPSPPVDPDARVFREKLQDTRDQLYTEQEHVNYSWPSIWIVWPIYFIVPNTLGSFDAHSNLQQLCFQLFTMLFSQRSHMSSSNGMSINQPNLSPWTPRSVLFVPELLTEIFKYSTLEDLRVYVVVCSQWEEPAQARLLETVRLHTAQMRCLHAKPTFRRYVRSLITVVDFDTPVHELLVPEWEFSSKDQTPYCYERPMNIASWHLVGPVPFRPSKFLISGINSYSKTLHTFHVHDSIWLDLEGFCDLLNALGNCRRLENLALPTDLSFFHNKTLGQRIAECEQAFSTRLIPSVDRPQIVHLQLVSTNRRYRLCAAKPMKAIHTVWLPHPNCPLSFVDTLHLIVGQGEDLQRILPLVPKLQSLEVCCEHPRLWRNYNKLLEAPLRLHGLKSLRIGFRLMGSLSAFLRVVDIPNIESIKIRYDWMYHPFHSPSVGNSLSDVVQEVAKLGVGRSFPKLLKEIYLEGSWYTPPSMPVIAEPPEWFQDIFGVMVSNNVQLLLEQITLEQPVFMKAHDALY